jgi:hypothetical protein
MGPTADLGRAAPGLGLHGTEILELDDRSLVALPDLTDEAAVIDVAMSKGEYRLFATMMVTMAGLDLLAKFWAGSDEIGKVGERIKGFAERYIFANAKDPKRSDEILYQAIRNPLLHSFTLYDKKLQIWLLNRQPGFDIIENPQKAGHVLISVEGIYLAFIRGLKAYEAELVGSADLKTKFEAMYELYGTTVFGIMPAE